MLMRSFSTHRLRPLHSILNSLWSGSPIYTHPADSLESGIGEDKDPAVVGFEVIDLLSEYENPKVFADELDSLEGIRRSRLID